jgi:hypothetical protein
MTGTTPDPSLLALAELQLKLANTLSEVFASHAAALSALGQSATAAATTPAEEEPTARLRTRTDDHDTRLLRARVLEAVEAGCNANGGYAPYGPVYDVLEAIGKKAKSIAGYTTHGWLHMHNLDPTRPRFISHYSLTEKGRLQLADDRAAGVI